MKLKNTELIGKEKTLKESIATYESGKSEYEKQIEELKKQIENASGNDLATKSYYENEKTKYEAKMNEVINALTAERDEFKKYKMDTLKRNAINKGIEGIRFADENLKEGFIALCEKEHNFKPTEIDGSIKFLDENSKDIADVLKEMALSEKGKSYIANTVSGSSKTVFESTGKKADGNIDIVEIQKMYLNPATRERAKKLMIEAGFAIN